MNKIELSKLKEWLIIPLKKDSEVWFTAITPPWGIASILSRVEFKNFKIKLKNRAEVLKKIDEEFSSISSVEDVIDDVKKMNKLGSLLEENFTSNEEDINFEEEAPITHKIDYFRVSKFI